MRAGQFARTGQNPLLAYAHEVDRDDDPAEAYVDYSNGK